MEINTKKENILGLRMERQHLITPSDREEYIDLYRDTQPGQSIYWHGFGQPPVLSFRADFDDMELNRITRPAGRKFCMLWKNVTRTVY